MKVNKIYKVVWNDAFGVNTHWKDLDLMEDEKCLVTSIGYVKKNKSSYQIIPHLYLSQDGAMACGIMTVPKKMIVSMKRLK